MPRPRRRRGRGIPPHRNVGDPRFFGAFGFDGSVNVVIADVAAGEGDQPAGCTHGAGAGGATTGGRSLHVYGFGR